MAAGHSRASRVLALFALANLLSYASRNAPFAVYDDLTARFGVDEAELGWLGTVFMIPHALATLPLGWFGDRLDRRKVIAAGVALWSLAGVAGALMPTYGGVLLSRALVGLGTAAVVPPANAVLGELYAGRNKAFALAIFNVGLFLGGVFGLGLGAWLGYRWGWIAVAAPGFALAVVLLLLRVPQGVATGSSWRQLLEDAAAVVRIRTIRRLMTATAVMAFAAGGIIAWMVKFLQDDKGAVRLRLDDPVNGPLAYTGMSQGGATAVLGVCSIAGLVGIISGGRVGDRLRRRWPWGRPGAMALGMACAVPCALASVIVRDTLALYLAAAGTMYFASWYHGPMASSIDDAAPPRLAATAQAVALFTTHLLGTASSSRVLGEIYEREGPRTAMTVAACAIAVAALLVTRAFGGLAHDVAARDAAAGGPLHAIEAVDVLKTRA